MCKLIKIYIIFAISIYAFTFVIADKGLAQGRDKTYVRMVNTSSKVGLGTIMSRVEIRYDYDGVNMRCGYVLDIAVNKSWKGGEAPFKLFVSNSDILENTAEDAEFFIMASRNNAFEKTGQQAIAFTNCDGGRYTRMNMSSFPFLATRLTQQIFPIISYSAENPVTDEDTGIIKRGDWLMIVNRIANNALPFTISRRRLNTGNPNVIEEMSFSDFLYEFNLE